ARQPPRGAAARRQRRPRAIRDRSQGGRRRGRARAVEPAGRGQRPARRPARQAAQGVTRARSRQMTATEEFIYHRLPWAYDLLQLPREYRRYRKIRPQIFRGLSGRILEVAVGTGRNFPFYPPGSQVVAIDQSPAMLARAQRRRAAAAAPVELRQMDVTRL